MKYNYCYKEQPYKPSPTLLNTVNLYQNYVSLLDFKFKCHILTRRHTAFDIKSLCVWKFFY
jgi:hypothetical protein